MSYNRIYSCEYRHRDVLSVPGQFRLLRLKQRTNNRVPDDILTVSFHNADLADLTLDYIALSYAWGSEQPTAHINIKKGRKIYTKSITPTLKEALQKLQLGQKWRWIWIDALCINQDSDSKEKPVQVMQMDRIYHSAQAVFIWLGAANKDSDQAMRFIRRLSRTWFDELLPLVTYPSYIEQWKALCALVARPWFSRRWIIQEILLARSADMHCGDETVSWEELKCAVEILIANLHDISRMFRKQMQSKFPPVEERHLEIPYNAAVHYTLEVCIREEIDLFSGIPHSAVGRLIKWQNQFISHDKGEILKKATLEHLVSALPGFQVSEPRDSLYALCALAADVEKFYAQGLAVDYNIPVLELCITFLKYCINTSQSLDIILRPWAPDFEHPDNPKLPSWIQKSSSTEFTRNAEGKLIRANGVGFVNRSGSNTYKASGGTKSDAYITASAKGSNSMSYELVVTAFLVDFVGQIGAIGVDGVPQLDWLELIRQQYSPQNGAKAELQFKRVLLAGHLPRDYLRDHDLLMRRANIWDGLGKLKPKEKIMGVENDEFEDRAISVAFGRRLFITQTNMVGLGPGNVQGNDLVCVLHGCSVPVILRPIECSSDELYELIGEAYLDTMMKGEAMNGNFPEKQLRII